ncbi:MAG: hypothetical protein BGO41_13255 [Clostridiales bacterium 38-18]|nr:MAG: hypothetical protein BGO41_13255 [Clostridiales bacterium 38-18]
MEKFEKITISTVIDATLETVWQAFTLPEHITKWNFASDDWHCPSAINNLVSGGAFSYRMASKKEDIGFDFGGTYLKVEPLNHISYELGDGRVVSIDFKSLDASSVLVEETFDAEKLNPLELQRNGWQAILNNFKSHAESL